MEPLFDMGYCLYTDNWYTADPLAEFLLSRDINITGVVCVNQKFLPAEKKNSKRRLYRKNNVLCIGWPKKSMLLLSAEGSSKMMTYTTK